MFPIQSVLHILLVWIQIINDHIGIATVAGSEDNQLEFIRELFQYFLGSRTNVNAGNNYFPIWESYWKLYVVRLLQIFVAVDQSFVQIEYHCFFI